MAATLRLLFLVVLLAPVTCAQIDVPALLPKSTLVHVEITPGPVRDGAADLAIANIWNELEVQRFAGPLKAMLDAQFDQLDGAMREQVGLGFRDLVSLWETRFTFSLISVKPGAPGDPGLTPDMLLTLDLGEGVDVTRGAIDKLELLVAEGLGGTFSDGKIAGRTVRVLHIGDADGVYYTFHETTLLVTTTSTTMERLLGVLATGSPSESLSEHGDFIKARDRVRTDKTVLWAFMELQGLLEILWLNQAPDVQRDFSEIFITEAYQTFYYGMDVDGRGVRERFSTRLPEDTDWTLAPGSDAKAIRLPEFLPAETGMVTCGVVQFDEAYDQFMPTLEERYPREAATVRGLLDTLGQKLGIDVRRDLLPSLGPEYAIYLSWPGAAVIPDVGFAFEVRRSAREKIRDTISTIKTALAGDVEIRELTFRGTKIQWLDLTAMADAGDLARPGPHTLKPSFALVGDYLVITLWPQSLKNLIHGLDKGTPRLKDAPDFKRLRAEVSPESDESSLFYVDLTRATGFVLDNATPIFQMLVPPSLGQGGVDLAALPTSRSVTRHMFGMLGVSRWDGKNAMYSEMYSPSGVLPSYVMAAGAMASWLFLRFDMMLEPGASPSGVLSAPFATAVQAPTRLAGQTPSAKARTDLGFIASQLRAYEAWEGHLPPEKEWAKLLQIGSSNHRAPYVPSSRMTDPWGRAYLFKPDGKGGFQVATYGSDGKPGGEGPAADVWVQ